MLKEATMTAVTVLTATDLHQSRQLYADLRKAVAGHQPDIVAIVGDCLHAGEDMDGRLTLAESAAILASLPCNHVVFVRGNHEDENWLEFAECWHRLGRPLATLNGEVFQFGPLVLVGFPCLLGTEDYFIAPREPLPCPDEEWLTPLLDKHGLAARTLWLMHEPPKGTILSRSSGPLAGNSIWTQAIERFAPRLVVFGHDHDIPIRISNWHCRVGNSTCINVGQTSTGPLHYTVVTAKFSAMEPNQLLEITVTAYPVRETINISG